MAIASVSVGVCPATSLASACRTVVSQSSFVTLCGAVGMLRRPHKVTAASRLSVCLFGDWTEVRLLSSAESLLCEALSEFAVAAASASGCSCQSVPSV
jgi:hypothetical protein